MGFNARCKYICSTSQVFIASRERVFGRYVKLPFVLGVDEGHLPAGAIEANSRGRWRCWPFRVPRSPRARDRQRRIVRVVLRSLIHTASKLNGHIRGRSCVVCLMLLASSCISKSTWLGWAHSAIASTMSSKNVRAMGSVILQIRFLVLYKFTEVYILFDWNILLINCYRRFCFHLCHH